MTNRSMACVTVLGRDFLNICNFQIEKETNFSNDRNCENYVAMMKIVKKMMTDFQKKIVQMIEIRKIIAQMKGDRKINLHMI